MRPTFRLFACLAAGLSFLSCGPASYPSQVVLPDGGLIPGTTCSSDRTVCWTITPSATAAVNDGNTPTTVVVTLTQGGTPVPDGSQGTFAFQGASSASFVPIQPGAMNTTTFQGNSANGQITIQVYDLAVETVTISLTAEITYSTSSTSLASTQAIKFGGACSDSFLTPASASSSLSGIAATVTLHCNDAVMGGSFSYQQNHPYDGNTQSCTALVEDINEQAVTGAAVQFLTEAGAVETDVTLPGQHPTEITDSEGEAAVNFHVGAPYPEDVPYDPVLDQDVGSAQTNTWADTMQQRMWTDSTGHTYNPRDGWVTLIAATAGKPPGGPSTLVPEPYVDSNDNGQWDPGEPFIDVNCNDKFDPVQTPDANGYVRVWSSTVVVWTDEPYPTLGDPPDPAAVAAGIVSGEIPSLESPPNCSSYIVQGTTCSMTFRFVDKNSNLPSAMLGGNLVTGNAPASGCSLTVGAPVALDLNYVSHPLALTDFAVTLTDAPVPIPPGAVQSGYTWGVNGLFNYVDPTEAENSNLELLSPINYGPLSVGGQCDMPAN